MNDNDAFGWFLALVFCIVAMFAMKSCDNAQKEVRCAENFERHALTASDTLALVRAGCELPTGAK